MKIFLDANICLDLLDTTRPTAKESIKWYMLNKDDISKEFYFSGDFITTFYYILTQKRKLLPKDVINAIDTLCMEIEPIYLTHSDFSTAKNSFVQGLFDDFEDLIVIQCCVRNGCEQFITNDKKLLNLSIFGNIDICKP